MGQTYVRKFADIDFHEIQIDPSIHHPMAKVTTKRLIDTSLNLGIKGFTLLCGKIEPGGYTSPHKHTVERAFFYLSGHALLTIGGQEHTVGPYDTVVIPPGTEHAYKNVGDEPCLYLEICVPAHHGIFDNKKYWPWDD